MPDPAGSRTILPPNSNSRGKRFIIGSKQGDLDSGRRNDGLTSDERVELSRLRRENKQLKVEREILSKAAVDSMNERNAWISF